MARPDLVVLDGDSRSGIGHPLDVTSFVPYLDSQPLSEMSRAAWADAERAARNSRVVVRHLESVDEMRATVELFDAIWRPSDGSIMNIELLQALSSAGSYVAGAYDGDVLLGACAGLWGSPSSRTIHSHIAGVADQAAGRHLGFALKVHQRAWAMSQGVETITWTFDPLVRRNAYFNIAKLGGTVQTYLVNHYGAMLDELNGDDESDRLKLVWHLGSSATRRLCASQPEEPRSEVVEAVLVEEADGSPGIRESSDAEVLVQVPADIESIRRADPGLAAEWRLAVRDVLGGLFINGWSVEAFDRAAGGYIVKKGNNS